MPIISEDTEIEIDEEVVDNLRSSIEDYGRGTFMAGSQRPGSLQRYIARQLVKKKLTKEKKNKFNLPNND